MVDARGRAMRMRYDAAGRLVGFTERRGGVWEIAWNEAGTRPVRRGGPAGLAEAVRGGGAASGGPWRGTGPTASWRTPSARRGGRRPPAGPTRHRITPPRPGSWSP